MSSCCGENIKISIFGQSHSPAMGVTIDGLPPGRKIDTEALQRFMERRAPGRNEYSTARQEADTPEIICGIKNGVTCGAPLTVLIHNTNQRPGDYEKLKNIPRPGHADFTAQIKYGGAQDASGGGHFSGRLTAPLCAAGGIIIQLLRESGISIFAHIYSIYSEHDRPFDPVSVGENEKETLNGTEFPVLDAEAGEKMKKLIAEAKAEGDSVGGIVECAVTGLPAGVGDAMFGGLESRISQIVFGIPAVKGIEFGAGFAVSGMKGSENNDAFVYSGGKVVTKTNNHGGILGGISSAMPLIFRAVVKPTPSIAVEQDSVDLSTGKNVRLKVGGRHDPCIVPRAVPCVEAAAAIAIYDAYLDYIKLR